MLTFRGGLTLKNLLLAFAVLALVGLTMGVSKTGVGGFGYIMLGGIVGACLLPALRRDAQPEFTIGAIFALIVVSGFLLSRDNDSSTRGYTGVVIMTVASLLAGAVSSFLFFSIHVVQEDPSGSSSTERADRSEEN
jgi:hypothetical protein